MVAPEACLSCARCHKRKKRCDKALPACRNCQTARVRCSFLDNDSQTSASYPVAYVRSLEARVQTLERQLVNGSILGSAAGSTPAAPSVPPPTPGSLPASGPAHRQHHPPGSLYDPSMPPAGVSDMPDMYMDTRGGADGGGGGSTGATAGTSASPGRPEPPTWSPCSPQFQQAPSSQASQQQQHQRHQQHTPGQVPPQSPSFAQELKALSLEATAERHLGSSSGVSFAKLTQMILRRLTPDKADFVFSSEQNDMQNDAAQSQSQASAPPLGLVAAISDPQLNHFDSPSDLFNSSVFHSLGQSISVHPLLFGDVFLADITEPDTAMVGLPWPPSSDDAHIHMLVDFYFAHSNTLYPIIVRKELEQTMAVMREESLSSSSPPSSSAAAAAASTAPSSSSLSPLLLFRVWMVLAIGATAMSSVSLTEESEPMLYYNKALQFSESALALDEMAALEVLTLQVSYSFFNQLGPNTWFLVGTSARLALGLGLHTASTYEKMPADAVERRKRIFFSIYMMDRLVSIALGRPFAIHDDDIDVEPFQPVDDEAITPDGIYPPNRLQPSIMAVPRHILSLRQIASRIARQVYANRQASELSVAQREDILTALHQELIDWRRTMPFPLVDIDSRVPHLSSTWYDFNYYSHLASLYRPSPLFPIMDQKRVKILENAAAMSLRQAYTLHQQRRFAYNWLNLLALFTATLSLIYATTAQPESLATVLRETRAIDDLELALELFSTLGVKFSAARKIRGMVAEICKRYKDVRRQSWEGLGE